METIFMNAEKSKTNESYKFILELSEGLDFNQYRSEITTQLKNNNLDYIINPTFRNIIKLFALSFKNGGNDPSRNSFDKY